MATTRNPDTQGVRENGVSGNGKSQTYGTTSAPGSTTTPGGTEGTSRYGATQAGTEQHGRYYSDAVARSMQDERMMGTISPRSGEQRDFSGERSGQYDEYRADRTGNYDRPGSYGGMTFGRGRDRGFEGWSTDFGRRDEGRHGRDFDRGSMRGTEDTRWGRDDRPERMGREEGNFEHGRAGFRDFGTPSYGQGRELREDYSQRDFQGRDDRFAGRSGTSFHPESMGATEQRSWRTPEEEWERSHYRGRAEENRGHRIWDREDVEAREVMTANVKTVRRDATLREVAIIMRDENCGIVPVIDEQNRLIGLITDRDMVMRTVDQERTWANIRVSEVMTDDIECVTPETSVHHVIKMMGRKQVRRMPVVDRGDRLLGMISMADIANRADKDHELQQALDRISKRRSFWSRLWS